MGLDTESDSQRSCSSDLSPNTVLPFRQFSSAEKRTKSSKVSRKDELLTAKDGFTEISFRRYRSASCKTHSRPLESKIELRRGSVYQSSREVREMKKIGGDERRRKIELSQPSNNSFSFSVLDSLCSLDEEKTQNKYPTLSNGFIEIVPELVKREKQSAERVRSDSIENSTLKCEQIVVPVNDANELLEKDVSLTFHKSLSAKVENPYCPSPSESDCSSKAISKSRYNPIRKMFDPFMKSKSSRSPLGHISETVDVKTTKNPILRKSLMNDFSNIDVKLDTDSQLAKKDHHQSSVASSPVHLHGCLKLESKQGVPYLKFSMDCPEETLIAKTWKGNNSFNWVYTFHSNNGRKRSNATSWGLTDGNMESSVIGQMKVSSFVCSEVKDGGFCDNSVLTEFVLYDIAHGRQSFSSQDDSIDNDKPPKNELGNPCPWPSSMLHSDLEIAAVVIQLPIDKRESLKYEIRDKSSSRMHSNTINCSKKGTTERESQDKVKVVIPTGNHSLPNDESRGPSRLLDRWRSGGGCDCGGWDMGCPITIFGSQDEPLVANQRSFEIFLQGVKQKLPALTMAVVEEGTYAVDFHAQLSTLQAFSICVAVLHRTEGSSAKSREDEKSKQLSHCNSLKVLIEEEVHFLITEEEEKTKKISKKTEEIQQSYGLNPPFSPIARV